MSTIVRAPLVFVAALAMLGTSVPLSGQAVAKAGPRGTAATAARASAPAAVRVSRPPEGRPALNPAKQHLHDAFRRGYRPYGYFPVVSATRTVIVEPTVIYVDNSHAHTQEHGEVLASRPADEESVADPGAKRLVWKAGGITPAEPRNAPEPSASVEESATLVRYVPLYDLDLVRFSDRDCEETQIQQRQDPRRLPWGLGWLQRYGRDVEVERGGVAPPSLYLRSPLLSGLYRRPDCPRERTEVEVTCAVVSLVADDDAAMSIEVPLPQLDATSPRQLRDIIRDALEDGETVVLMTTEDEEFDLMPGSVRQVDATACRGD